VWVQSPEKITVPVIVSVDVVTVVVGLAPKRHVVFALIEQLTPPVLLIMKVEPLKESVVSV
jgi:hypothetical protein